MWIRDHEAAKLALLCCDFFWVSRAKEVLVFRPTAIDGQPIVPFGDWKVIRKGIVTTIKAWTNIFWGVKNANAVVL